MYEPSEQQARHGRVDPGFTDGGELLKVTAEPSKGADPGESPFDDPAPGEQDEPRLRGPLHDLQPPPISEVTEFLQVTGVTLVCPHQLEPREMSGHRLEYLPRPVAVLHVGRMDDHFEQLSERVYHDVPFASVDPLPAVIAACPPFRVVFTL